MIKFFKNLNKRIRRVLSDTYYPLESEFARTVKKIQGKNSQVIWSHYYVPRAIREILEKEKNLTASDGQRVSNLAASMLLRDLAEGKLTELYKFKEAE